LIEAKSIALISCMGDAYVQRGCLPMLHHFAAKFKVNNFLASLSSICF